MSNIDVINCRIFPIDSLNTIVARWKAAGETIVFTNGCFDIIHPGHLQYLAKAADYGNRLIIGINTDESVRKLKGPGRPVIGEEDRARLLASIFFVSAVTLFNEETPYELIKSIQPDVLVKGSDYKAEEIVGYDIVTARGGKVLTIDFLEGYSTTSIIEKLNK